MGCGCGKGSNAIRRDTGKAKKAAVSDAIAKTARKNRLKMIRVKATNRVTPKKQK